MEVQLHVLTPVRAGGQCSSPRPRRFISQQQFDRRLSGPQNRPEAVARENFFSQFVNRTLVHQSSFKPDNKAGE
jgi:hypothetical protein